MTTDEFDELPTPVLAIQDEPIPRLARGTREWVKDPPLGRLWLMEYAMFCLGHGLAVAGACEFYYRLGKAHHDFEQLRSGHRSIVVG